MALRARGPQVVLEGYARTVARGGAGRTMRDNIAAMDALVSAGLVADGNAVDGSSRSGGTPYDAVVAQFPRETLSGYEVPTPLLNLNLAGAIVGGDFGVNGDLTVTGELAGPVTATATMTPRMLADRFADVVNVRDFGAVFDGASHPLSGYFPDLASAQADYPHAVALTDEIDGVAIQAAINLCQSRVTSFSYGGTVQLPCGNGLVNRPLTISRQNVSLESQGHGFLMYSNVSNTISSAPTRLTWTGAPVAAGTPQNRMLTVAPTDGGRMLTGTNVRGILFYCNKIVGTSGVLIASVRFSTIECAAWEPAGVPYAGASLTAGSQTITISSTAGLRVGESVVSASLPGGLYVASIIDATHFNASAQASATSTETVTIGGEGIRIDVVDGLQDSNDTQGLRVWFGGYALAGAANATGPLVMIGGSCVNGGSGGAHFGNTSLNWFDDFQLIHSNGHALVINNSDHNFFKNISAQRLGGGNGSMLICNGTLDPKNGGGRFHRFGHMLGAGAIVFVGTDTGGFTNGSVGCAIDLLDLTNTTPYPTVGANAAVRLNTDFHSPSLGWVGSGPWAALAVAANIPDSTALGGNTRGINAVDLQTLRTAATQVASGRYSVLVGGNAGTASNDYAAVGGGSGNNAAGLYSTVPGGLSNQATGTAAIATGTQAFADLYAAKAHSSGIIATGRRAQYVMQPLRGVSAANTTPVRLTADLAAAGAANVCNLTFVDSVYAVRVQVAAMDSTTNNNFYVWTQPLGLLKRNGTVGTVTYTPGTPVSQSVGTTTGIAITEAADTTNAGYSLTFTPPTSNTSVWRIAATVEWTRVDGG